jgi:thiamine biosynthesis lipoprotein
MGTRARATVADRSEAGALAAIDEVRRIFDRVDATMSNWAAESDLSRLNRGAGRGAVRVEDAGLASCIEAALDAARLTGGAYDPTVGPLMTLWGFRSRSHRVPDDAAVAEALTRVGADKVRYAAQSVSFDREGMELDLGGVAVGCALDEARVALAGRGRRFGLLDVGGDLAWFGDPPGGNVVAVIADPRRPEAACAEARLPGGSAAATSSNLENRFTAGGVAYGHIMDPRTGRPASTDIVQATAFHRSATVTDVLSTALVVAGSERAAALLAAYPGAEAVLVLREGHGLALTASRSLEGRLTVEAAAGLAGPRFTLPAATMPPPPAR